MRIGIDARELCGRATGVGRYLSGLVDEWAFDDRARQHEFVLYAPEPIPHQLDARRFATRLVGGHPGTWWEQIDLPAAIRGDHLDVWFSPAYTAPRRLRIPFVVAIHDLSFVAHPEWFRLREGLRRRWLTTHAARHARAVITISQFSKSELIDLLNVPADRIHVIPPGIGAASREPRAANPETRAPSPVRVLYVGSIFNRRHVPDLIRAFTPIARAHPDAALDIVGDNRTSPHEDLGQTIASEDSERQVRLHHYVADHELHELYARAGAFAFLSEYEGLGLTPLEALAVGVPPVLLDTPVAHEACGDAALYVRAGDTRAITHALEEALFDEATRRRIRAAAPAALAKFDWPRAARETLAVLEASGVAI